MALKIVRATSDASETRPLRLWLQGREATAAVVVFCAVVAPSAYVTFMLAVLISLRRGRMPARLGALRRRNGALDLETIEASLVTNDGAVVDLTVIHKSRARYLIESLMIAANSVMAAFLEDHGSLAIELHFDLVPPGRPVRPAVEDIWRAGRDGAIGGAPVQLPAPEHLLLHLAIHAL